MTKTTLATAAALIALPAFAFAQLAPGTQVGTDEADIRAMLEAEGFQIEEIEFEDGEIEVEYLFEGAEYEMTLSPDGVVVSVELEDEEDDDDEDDSEDDDSKEG